MQGNTHLHPRYRPHTTASMARSTVRTYHMVPWRDHEHGHKASTQDRETHIICCRSAVTVHVNGQMSAVVAAKTLGGHSITSMTPASPPPVTRLHAWSSREQTPSLHGHVRLPLRVRKKPSRALRHRRTASCADTHVGQLQKFTLALCMHLLT